MSAKDILCTYIYKTNYKTLPPPRINIFNQIVITGTWGGFLNLNYEYKSNNINIITIYSNNYGIFCYIFI
jgi:hypothetical protein